ncbi:hypothetical protein V5799_029964 [Amblyomma americanum]|uniref:Large ribosomal subunit protein uL5 C-terminal domain-containing protein n=1 Tax=Amblyomma americanum TaxID=6943 RepID=A0AAQ4EPS2_AMBAM
MHSNTDSRFTLILALQCVIESQDALRGNLVTSFSHVQVREYELRKDNFSDTGNFGFGIQEHIDLGIKYDPTIGIYGLDFYVVLGRPGFNVAHRRHKKGTIGANHRLCKEEAIKWFQQKEAFAAAARVQPRLNICRYFVVLEDEAPESKCGVTQAQPQLIEKAARLANANCRLHGG